MNKIRPIAIYLPQFHPIPENNEWWGKGFTEWKNVSRGRPLFEGHYQPHYPADLGYYDLRLIDVMDQQIKMAKEHGIGGFCFYHYWFTGQRLLEMPVDRLLKNKELDFPFMLCWANENWTRRWDGLENEVLMEQVYSEEDDDNHMRHLIKYFKDDRYIKVDGKAVFIVYKTFLLPDPTETAKRWRAIAAEENIELYLCHMVFGYREENSLIEGFDAAIDFEPFGVRHGNVFTAIHTERAKPISIFKKVIMKIEHYIDVQLVPRPKLYNALEYSYYLRKSKSISTIPYKIYPSLVPGWDNTARKPDNPALVLTNSSPELFGDWFAAIKNDFKPYSKDENFIFINAWNEWAEGNHLEPDQRFGLGYLEAVLKNL